MKAYNAAAQRVQAAWRGYSSRKNVVDFYARREYLAALAEHTAALAAEQAAKQAEMDAMAAAEEAAREETRRTRELAGRHFMLSTRAKPGVYHEKNEGGRVSSSIRKVPCGVYRPMLITIVPHPCLPFRATQTRLSRRKCS